MHSWFICPRNAKWVCGWVVSSDYNVECSKKNGDQSWIILKTNSANV